MGHKLPQISGMDLIALFKGDGWTVAGECRHGKSLIKRVGDRTLVTVIPHKRDLLPKGTLKAILNQAQMSNEDLYRLIHRKKR